MTKTPKIKDRKQILIVQAFHGKVSKQELENALNQIYLSEKIKFVVKKEITLIERKQNTIEQIEITNIPEERLKPIQFPPIKELFKHTNRNKRTVF